MKRKLSPIEKAYRLYYAGEYAKVITLLEPQVFMYREKPGFYRLLGLACLHTGDLGGAHSYLMRCTQLDRDAVAPRLELAACHFARRDNDSALQLWLEILDDDPDNKHAALGLRVLRSGPESEEAQRYREPEKLKTLYPDIRRPFPWKKPAAVVGVLVLAALAFQLAPALGNTVGQAFSGMDTRARRAGVENTEIEPRADLTEPGDDEDVRYDFGDAEIEQTFEQMRDYFLDERDNMAAREINRILYSNATSRLKERARTLQAYLNVPGFTDFTDGFSYQEVTGDPWLHEGTYVRWQGRPSNVDVNDDRIAFDFLVGYEDGRQIDGIVPAEFDFAVRIDSRHLIELIARVERVDGDEIRLQGVSTRILGPAEGS